MFVNIIIVKSMIVNMKCDILLKITRFTIKKIRYDRLDCRFSHF